jgi:hypothetical protein
MAMVENGIDIFLSKSPQKDLLCFKNDDLPIVKKKKKKIHEV